PHVGREAGGVLRRFRRAGGDESGAVMDLRAGALLLLRLPSLADRHRTISFWGSSGRLCVRSGGRRRCRIVGPRLPATAPTASAENGALFGLGPGRRVLIGRPRGLGAGSRAWRRWRQLGDER